MNWTPVWAIAPAHRPVFQSDPQRNGTSNLSAQLNRERDNEHLEQIWAISNKPLQKKIEKTVGLLKELRYALSYSKSETTFTDPF